MKWLPGRQEKMVAAKASVWERSPEERWGGVGGGTCVQVQGYWTGSHGQVLSERTWGTFQGIANGSCSRWAMWGPDLRKESEE